MYGIKRILTASLVFLGFFNAYADDSADVARAATRRSASATVQSDRTQSDTTPPIQSKTITNRTNNALSHQDTNTRERTAIITPRTSSTNISQNIINRTTSTNDDEKTLSARATTGNIQSRGALTTYNPTTSAGNGISRVAIPTTTGTDTRAKSINRAGISLPTTATRSATTPTRVSRSATITAVDILTKDYTKCRTVYYDCMDEFCANKDAQLKRCACSTRANEFDAAKKQLAETEEKLLDFNQRLLTVNMDKEDADALFNATEGELAFNQKDTSASKELLDEIGNKLNTSFDDSKFDSSLNAISLSLNTSSAFDTVDSLQGASTTSKSGIGLYNAAIPVCKEMAAEVCSPDELAIAESGYQMTIEQDCNTVAKSYATQTELAREKIREGSALLDMSRLDIYQKRNSDDILTCKSKMLDMLSSTTVCGKDLGKCLDNSGKYIDPSTGEAFLTDDLSELGNLITRPSGNTTWVQTSGNERFVLFLNSKKIFLEPAMESCQDISDSVWGAFLEDALAQIKIAQDRKLEDMRQSCTTLTTQCLSDTADSLEDFDARALSIFGVSADKTVNAMCSDITNACSALLETTDTSNDWIGGMTDITTDKTYATILSTCREVGKACITQSCESASGNFGLCENIQSSINRKSIINRTACWNEVQECVAAAGDDAIENIWASLPSGIKSAGNFYDYLYESTQDTDDICNCLISTSDCKTCRIAEQIWGNCEFAPTTSLSAADSHNKIKTTASDDNETLLAWFATNTGTEMEKDSCRDTSCGIGFVPQYDEITGIITCISDKNVSSDGGVCATNQIKITDTITNCCWKNSTTAGEKDDYGNCCATGDVMNISGTNICIPADTSSATQVLETEITDGNYYTDSEYKLVCIGNITSESATTEFPAGQKLNCSGRYIFIDKDGKYISPDYQNDGSETPNHPTNSFKENSTTEYKLENNVWTPDLSDDIIPNNWLITY